MALLVIVCGGLLFGDFLANLLRNLKWYLGGDNIAFFLVLSLRLGFILIVARLVIVCVAFILIDCLVDCLVSSLAFGFLWLACGAFGGHLAFGAFGVGVGVILFFTMVAREVVRIVARI